MNAEKNTSKEQNEKMKMKIQIYASKEKNQFEI